MRTIFLALAITFLVSIVFVRGYFRGDGTWVRPHVRTAPNEVRWDNWSCHGNVNPYTGRRGYRFGE